MAGEKGTAVSAFTAPSDERVVDDIRAASAVGLALANAAQYLDLHHSAMTRGGQMDMARLLALTVVGKAAEVEPDMTVTELWNLLDTGRR